MLSFNQLCDRLVKISLAIFACAILFFNATSPAFAAFGLGSNRSQTSEGTTQMNRLQDTSERVLKAEPRGDKEVRRKAQEGINEVQGQADRDKMKNPANSEATTVEEQVEDALENITPGN